MARVAVFVEDRLATNLRGVVVSENARLSLGRWRDLSAGIEASILCARVDLRQTEKAGAKPVGGTVFPLVYYQGLAPALANLPKLMWNVFSAVRHADLVVAKCPGLIGSLAVLIARAWRKRIVVHLVGDIEEVILDGSSSLARRFIATIGRLFTQVVVRKADLVRYPTRLVLQAKYPSAPDATEVWFTDADVVPAPRAPGIGDFVDGRIVAVGSQERLYKGHDVLIRALPLVKESYPTATLVLVGKGKKRPVLEALALDLGVAASVKFIDSLEGWDAVSAMMRSAHVFAMPSITEGLPRALLEAMSLGVACVGSDAGGIVELLPPDLTVARGSVNQLTDRLIEILSSEERRKHVASALLDRSVIYSKGALEANLDAWVCSVRDLAGHGEGGVGIER